MYKPLSERVRKVLQLANEEASRLGHEWVGTEHLLLGLVAEGNGVAANALKKLDVDLRKIRAKVEWIVQAASEAVAIERLPETPRARKAIEYSIEESRNLNHSNVGTGHLLLGLLRDGEGLPAQIFLNLNLNLEKLREEVLNLLGH
jgi:ATP-dependent Clp protease ATP-binding subunit ClpC